MTRRASSSGRVVIAVFALLVAWALVLANTLVAFEPDLVPQEVHGVLDPSVEFGPANAVSAGLFALLAAVAGWNAVEVARAHGVRRRQALGWAGFAALAAGLSIDELTDVHLRLFSETYLEHVGRELGFIRGYAVWVGLVAPLAALVAVAFVTFFRAEFSSRPLVRRAAWTGGFLWVTVLAHEALADLVFATRAPALGNLLEEGAELLGTAVFIAMAALARGRPPRSFEASSRSIVLVLAAFALIAGVWLGWRAEIPLNSWGMTEVWMGPFPAGTAAEQSLALPGGPLGRIDVQASYAAEDDRHGILAVRLRQPDGTAIREASATVVPGAIMAEHAARFTPVLTTAGDPAALQVAALSSVTGSFTLSVTRNDLQADGAVFPNGQPAPAGQDLNYRLYGPRDASFAKLAAIVRLVQRDPLVLAILVDSVLLLAAAVSATVILLQLSLNSGGRRR